MIKFFGLVSLVSLLLGNHAGAVQLGQNGMGEVLIYPYYSVNNELNTLYSVINTTDQPKAIKIHFQEGEFGHDVLNFNVYLDAYDVWTGTLVAIESSIAGHVDEPSVLHITTDTSCAPFLNKTGQEFFPYLIELDGIFNDNLSRAREGHLKIIEMGVLSAEAADAVNHLNTGLPRDCAMLEDEWADNMAWDLEDLGDPTGGLIGAATIVNVAEGLAFPYDAIALQNFWQLSAQHTEPGSVEPNLSSASPQSKVLLDNGELAESEWDYGYQAVSAVLMKKVVYNEYTLDSIINGKTEMVVSFPTKKYFTDIFPDVRKPFGKAWNGIESCDEYFITIFDREAQLSIISYGSVAAPPSVSPTACFSSNVLTLKLPGEFLNIFSSILGSNNQFLHNTPYSAVTESGLVRLTFLEDKQHMVSLNGDTYFGLPVTGFVLQQYTNASAGDGLLAQYGNVFSHKSAVEIELGL